MSNWEPHESSHRTSSLIQPRILRREWKRYKPHLQQSISLPALQLIPPNRPIFACGRCGYANTWISLCLWCEWTSDEATAAFERSMPRGRTVSAPAGMICRHLETIVAQPETRTIWVRTRKHSDVSVESSLPPVTPRDDVYSDTEKISHIATVLAEDSDHHVLPSFKESKSRRSSKRYGMITDFDDHSASAISKSWVCQPRLQDSASIQAYGHIPAPIPTPDFVKEAFTNHAEHPQSNIMELTFLPQSPSQGLHRVELGIDNVMSTHAPSSLSSPQRTLRRKKRMTLLKQKSSRSLRTRASAPLLGRDENDNLHTDEHRSVISPQPTLQEVPLGHPSRPYYTAIRPSMSRPSSPFETQSLAPSRAASPSRSIICAPSCLPNTFHPPNLALPAPHASYPYQITGSTIGFSMSGETELRMALARWRSLESDAFDVPTEYQFRDVTNIKGKGARGNGRFGGRMRRLGMSIMELVLGRK